MSKTAPNTDYFELLIWLPGKGPLRDIFKGATLAEAVERAERTHAGCLIEVPPPIENRSQLPRSSTSPSVQKRFCDDYIRSVRSKKV